MFIVSTYSLLPFLFLLFYRYPQQVSQPIFLDKCRIYKMEVFMYEGWGGDHVSVGMRKPSGEYERPIPRTRLFRTKPGNIEVCSCFKTSNVFTIVKR